MGDSTAQGPHLRLYDGECGFCHWVVRFVLARDRKGSFRFAALQSAAAATALAPFGGRPADFSAFYLVTNYQSLAPALLSRAAATFVVTDTLGWPWRALSAMRILPRPWTDAAYDLVARHRHTILGRANACTVPRPELRGRFLDADEAGTR